jgi:hypothetical protein
LRKAYAHAALLQTQFKRSSVLTYFCNRVLMCDESSVSMLTWLEMSAVKVSINTSILRSGQIRKKGWWSSLSLSSIGRFSQSAGGMATSRKTVSHLVQKTP